MNIAMCAAVTIIALGVIFGETLLLRSNSILDVLTAEERKYASGAMLICLVSYYIFSFRTLYLMDAEMLSILLAAYVLGVVAITFRIVFEQDFAEFAWLASLSCMAIFAVLGSGILNTIIGSFVGSVLYAFRKTQLNASVELALFIATTLALLT